MTSEADNIRYSRREKTRADEADDLEHRFIGEKGAAAIDRLAGQESRKEQTPTAKSATQRQAEQMKTYRNTAEQAAKSVGEEVTVVEKVEDIVDDDPKVQLKKRGAKGWYDPETGKVVVNLSAHSFNRLLRQQYPHPEEHTSFKPTRSTKSYFKKPLEAESRADPGTAGADANSNGNKSYYPGRGKGCRVAKGKNHRPGCDAHARG